MSGLIAKLIEAGTPADLIEQVALLVAKENALDERRERDRQRKKDQRSRNKTQPIQQSSHVTSQDIADVTENNPLSLPPKEINSNPPTHTPETKTRARKGTRLSEDWQPKPLTDAALKNVAGWPAGAIERELARFRDWAASTSGPNAVKKDWDAAWRQWLARTEDDGKYRNNRNGTTNRNSGNRTLDAAQGARERLANRPNGSCSSNNGPNLVRANQVPQLGGPGGYDRRRAGNMDIRSG